MYQIVIDEALFSKLSKLRKRNRPLIRILDRFLLELGQMENPRSQGKPFSGNLSGFWRYRIGDYRLLCEIQDKMLIVVAFEFDHRSRVYNLGSLLKYARAKKTRKIR
ncbi:MAG: type II toxin-antitoxin system RelE/ParE family toxin [Synergistaceae bacterium]|nr:type II toxin-antitoxin system RelE/ParE family toxin [Synergistaceae bacterium]